MKKPIKPIVNIQRIFKSKIDNEFYNGSQISSANIMSISLKDIETIKAQYPGYDCEIEPWDKNNICVILSSIIPNEYMIKYEEEQNRYNEYLLLRDLNVAKANAEIALKQLEAAQAAVINIERNNNDT